MVDVAELDQLQQSHRDVIEKWIAAIRQEEALASVDHELAEVDKWEAAELKEGELRTKVLAAKKRYEDALRENFLASSFEDAALRFRIRSVLEGCRHP